ncbi:phage head closure protein [Kaistia sp. MMO-174]|uniref:phage head closure protein n=1 Tax=Kaistia sp. MMO-174 TaxID=3081256 RepID=UPI00301625BB
MSAGELRERVAFDRRAAVDDGYGNMVAGDWQEQFVVWARIQPLKGGEGVQAARLAGTQPVIIRVRSSSSTRQIRTDWRARDARIGTLFNITSMANMDEKGAYLDLLATSGEAVG